MGKGMENFSHSSKDCVFFHKIFTRKVFPASFFVRPMEGRFVAERTFPPIISDKSCKNVGEK